MQSHDFNEVHSIMIRAAPERIFVAIRAVIPADVPIFRILLGIRSLPAWLTAKPVRALNNSRSILEQVLSGGFVFLGEIPNEELVVGTIGRFWVLRGGSAARATNAAEFAAFSQPGYAKAATNFYVAERNRAGQVRLVTETRIVALDPIARKKFARYWRIIYPGSALIRRAWLRAIKRRAEQTQQTHGIPATPHANTMENRRLISVAASGRNWTWKLWLCHASCC